MAQRTQAEAESMLCMMYDVNDVYDVHDVHDVARPRQSP